MMKIMIMMKRMMIMKGGREGTPGGGAGAGRGSSAGPRWAADFRQIQRASVGSLCLFENGKSPGNHGFLWIGNPPPKGPGSPPIRELFAARQKSRVIAGVRARPPQAAEK